MSSPDRWADLERLYHEAAARTGEERERFLRGACAGDARLKAEVESLLASDASLEGFLTTPALDIDALIADETAAMTGRAIGPYTIGALLGAGGMGDVYRARDNSLGRDVAIKFLPDALAFDADRRARFTREARLLAALNHPHIAAIYGVEDRDGLHALVLELAEGGTLADVLANGPLPIGDALIVARQMADALDAAHAKGIVHRDLKPANVGCRMNPPPSLPVVKVLDFGLAKSTVDAVPAGAATHAGVVLGTSSYMSPEQARGLEVDARADVWAFGCVLYEMLTGAKAFDGATASDTIAAILDREPDWSRLPDATPAPIAALLHRCLQKDPGARLQRAADARAVIDEVIAAPHVASVAAVRRRRRGRDIAARVSVAAAALVVIAAAYQITKSRGGRRAGTPTRLSVSTPGVLSPQLSAAISPEGRRIAFVSTGASGKLMLGVRALDSLDARVLPGTENAAHPFWSPDGRALAFLADGKLKRLDLDGERIETLADAPDRSGATWNRDGRILFASRPNELGSIAAAGGPITTVIARDPADPRSPRWPAFLPDGHHFIFFRTAARAEERGVYLGSLEAGTIRQLVQSEFRGAYASGYLLFVDGERLMAQAFDADRLQLTGAPTRVADGVWTARGAGQASFSVSEAGVLAYVNASLSNRQLGLFDRTGRPLGSIGAAARLPSPPQFSPDGRRVASAQGAPGDEHIWILDVATSAATQLTSGPGSEVAPVWSADGRRVIFQSSADGRARLVATPIDGGAGELAIDAGRMVSLDDWSPDGRLLVYTAMGPRSYSDLWLLPVDPDGDRKPAPFAQSAFNKTQAQVSPDGRWIAYTSYESGTDEVFVDSFPTPGRKRQLSAGGGVQPRWRRDGRELFYVAPDQRLMAIALAGGPAFEAGPPVPLFKTRLLPHGSQSIGLHTQYAVSPDGQRFVCVVPPDDPEPPISVVLDWIAALR